MRSSVLIIRGILAFVLGLILVFWPGETLDVLLIFFPIFVIIDGISAIIIGSKASKEGMLQSFIPMGILEIVIGILIFFWPDLTIYAFVFIMALWAFVLGFGELVIAFMDKMIKPASRWLFAIAGIFTIILGVLVASYPFATTLILLWLFGLFFMIYGILLFIAGLWASSHAKSNT